MTRLELQEEMEIHWRSALPGADVFEDFSKMAVQYAISALEWVQRDNQPYDICVELKIQELKKQLQ